MILSSPRNETIETQLNSSISTYLISQSSSIEEYSRIKPRSEPRLVNFNTTIWKEVKIRCHVTGLLNKKERNLNMYLNMNSNDWKCIRIFWQPMNLGTCLVGVVESLPFWWISAILKYFGLRVPSTFGWSDGIANSVLGPNFQPRHLCPYGWSSYKLTK